MPKLTLDLQLLRAMKTIASREGMSTKAYVKKNLWSLVDESTLRYLVGDLPAENLRELLLRCSSYFTPIFYNA